MGIMADSLVAYAQPLIDAGNGSLEEMNRSMSIAQFCWNLAVTPEEKREDLLLKFKADLGLDEADFEEFRENVFLPMIDRHIKMFPLMHARLAAGHSPFSPEELVPMPVSGDEPIRAGRNDPCPCGSGKKFKKCCMR